MKTNDVDEIISKFLISIIIYAVSIVAINFVALHVVYTLTRFGVKGAWVGGTAALCFGFCYALYFGWGCVVFDKLVLLPRVYAILSILYALISLIAYLLCWNIIKISPSFFECISILAQSL